MFQNKFPFIMGQKRTNLPYFTLPYPIITTGHSFYTDLCHTDLKKPLMLLKPNSPPIMGRAHSCWWVEEYEVVRGDT